MSSGGSLGLGFPGKETRVKALGSEEAAEMLAWAFSHLISRETAPQSSGALGPTPSRKAQG